MDASTRTGEQDGVATATLAAGELEATFATGAGMVCCSLRHGGVELLGQRRGLATYAATGSTMGIPFLHPWANRLAGPRYEQGGCTVTLREGAPGVAPGGQRPAHARSAGGHPGLARRGPGGRGRAGPTRGRVQDAQRAVTVRFVHGYPFAQVFAPPGEAFVCFEPMTATVSALTRPGGCPLVPAYDAAFAVEVGSTMGA